MVVTGVIVVLPADIMAGITEMIITQDIGRIIMTHIIGNAKRFH